MLRATSSSLSVREIQRFHGDVHVISSYVLSKCLKSYMHERTALSIASRQVAKRHDAQSHNVESVIYHGSFKLRINSDFITPAKMQNSINVIGNIIFCDYDL